MNVMGVLLSSPNRSCWFQRIIIGFPKVWAKRVFETLRSRLEAGVTVFYFVLLCEFLSFLFRADGFVSKIRSEPSGFTCLRQMVMCWSRQARASIVLLNAQSQFFESQFRILIISCQVIWLNRIRGKISSSMSTLQCFQLDKRSQFFYFVHTVRCSRNREFYWINLNGLWRAPPHNHEVISLTR